MSHVVTHNSNNNVFVRIGMGTLVGFKEFRIKRKNGNIILSPLLIGKTIIEEYSFKAGYTTTSITNQECLFVLPIENIGGKMVNEEIEMLVPNGDYIQVVKHIYAGYHISPFHNNFYFVSRANISDSLRYIHGEPHSHDFETASLTVVFHTTDILFYDGRNVSVDRFRIATPEEFKLVNFALVKNIDMKLLDKYRILYESLKHLWGKR